MDCTTCGLVLPWTVEFFPRRTTKPFLESRCRTCKSTISRARYVRVKMEVLTHYAGGTPQCACCAEDTLEFLTIDHIHGGGGKHRAALKGKIAGMWHWLKRAGYPLGYRVLCMNCNLATGLYGSCPHKGPTLHGEAINLAASLTQRATGVRRFR